MSVEPAVSVTGVTHRYGDRVALRPFDLYIEPGEIFAILGPNGGGKTTLFRLISTLIPLTCGSIRVLGHDVARATDAARRQLGVVFQAPSLDRQLSVRENLLAQGPLYGLFGLPLQRAIDELLERFGLADRGRDRVDQLSGGLRRRVELAKGLLHRPRVLLLDEPSTGLDPGARGELWSYLRELRGRDGVTIVATTHLLEEAERVDRLAILDRGELVALDAPDTLRASLGGDTLTLVVEDPRQAASRLRERFGWSPQVVGETLRVEVPRAAESLAGVVAALGEDQLRTLTWSKPSLEDVFIARTGRNFWNEAEGPAPDPVGGRSR